MKAIKDRTREILGTAGFFVRSDYWAIAMYAGPSPTELGPVGDGRAPVLGARDVTDVDAEFVADPFIAIDATTGGWHMFFEVMNRANGRGEIALASSLDGLRWDYRQVVIAEPFHLSYPHVVTRNGFWYMIPETSSRRAVTLYKAVQFPSAWERVGDLITGRPFNDSTIFRHDGRWWMLTETAEDFRSDTLRLYGADDLLGPWVEHPASPVVEGDATAARPAGPVVTMHGRPVRFAQDCATTYGRRVVAFAITELTALTYAERPLGVVLEPAKVGWNDRGMHAIDAHQLADGRWLACVDGRPVPGLRRSLRARIPVNQRPRQDRRPTSAKPLRT